MFLFLSFLFFKLSKYFIISSKLIFLIFIFHEKNLHRLCDFPFDAPDGCKQDRMFCGCLCQLSSFPASNSKIMVSFKFSC